MSEKDQPTLPFGKAEKAIVPNDADLPAREVLKHKAKEMYACNWTVREIVATFRKFPDSAHVTEAMVNGWKQRENWGEYRRQVQVAIAKDQLAKIRRTASVIYSAMDRQIVGIQRRLFAALDGSDIHGNMVMSSPPQILDGAKIVELLLKSLEARRTLVADALDRTSESLPLVDPGALDLFLLPRDRIIDTPPPEPEEKKDEPERTQPPEDAQGSGGGQ